MSALCEWVMYIRFQKSFWVSSFKSTLSWHFISPLNFPFLVLMGFLHLDQW
jgi:hypothetical protein